MPKKPKPKRLRRQLKQIGHTIRKRARAGYYAAKGTKLQLTEKDMRLAREGNHPKIIFDAKRNKFMTPTKLGVNQLRGETSQKNIEWRHDGTLRGIKTIGTQAGRSYKKRQVVKGFDKRTGEINYVGVDKAKYKKSGDVVRDSNKKRIKRVKKGISYIRKRKNNKLEIVNE